MLGLDAKNGHGRESGRCAEKVDSPKESARRNYPGSRCLAGRGDYRVIRVGINIVGVKLFVKTMSTEFTVSTLTSILHKPMTASPATTQIDTQRSINETTHNDSNTQHVQQII